MKIYYLKNIHNIQLFFHQKKNYPRNFCTRFDFEILNRNFKNFFKVRLRSGGYEGLPPPVPLSWKRGDSWFLRGGGGGVQVLCPPGKFPYIHFKNFIYIILKSTEFPVKTWFYSLNSKYPTMEDDIKRNSFLWLVS